MSQRKHIRNVNFYYEEMAVIDDLEESDSSEKKFF